MNENAKKWVAALRSGKYKQTSGKLRTGDAFCCLGVACDIYDDTLWTPDGVFFIPPRDEGEPERSAGTLPKSLVAWLGLTSSVGSYKSDDDIQCLTADNDETGLSFDQIADIIESEPTGLFEVGK